jgi:hypothetical protein
VATALPYKRPAIVAKHSLKLLGFVLLVEHGVPPYRCLLGTGIAFVLALPFRFHQVSFSIPIISNEVYQIKDNARGF